MKVDQDHGAANAGQEFVHLAERIVAARHEDAALQVDDGVTLAVGEGAFEDAVAGRAVRVVGRAKHATAAFG